MRNVNERQTAGERRFKYKYCRERGGSVVLAYRARDWNPSFFCRFFHLRRRAFRRALSVHKGL